MAFKGTRGTNWTCLVIITRTLDDDQQGVMDNLLEALKTGSAFTVNRKDGRKRPPRAAGGQSAHIFPVV